MKRALLLAVLAILAQPACADTDAPQRPFEIPDSSLLLMDLVTGEPTVIKNPSEMTAEDGTRFIPQDKASQALYAKLVKDGREPIMAIIDVTKDYLARNKAKADAPAAVDAKQ